MKKLKLVTVFRLSLMILPVLTISALMQSCKKQKEPAIPVSVGIGSEELTEYMYETTGERFFYSDSDFGGTWLPVLANVPVCKYQADQYVNRNQQIYYTDGNQIISKFGIDVSSHQGEIDWQTVKESGVEFAMIRVGYRGYSEGMLFEDEYFEQNVRGAQNAGIDIGLYFYSQAVTPQEAEEEADMLLSVIGNMEDLQITYPVVYDWETVDEDTARTDNITMKTLTECTIAFCEKIRNAGYIPMIYQNKYISLMKLGLPELTDYDFWLAEYADTATYYYDYQMWQYASDASVPGIVGEVDVNVCFKDYTRSEIKESDSDA